MDKLFLQGLASGNYRKWGPTQYRRWQSLTKILISKTIGIENEIVFESREVMNQKLSIITSKTKSKLSMDAFGTWFYDKAMGSREFEIVALLDATKPYVAHKQLDNLIAFAESIGINMCNSTHINVVTKHSENIVLSEWAILTKCHAHSDFFTIDQNGKFEPSSRHSEAYRLENKFGTSSMFSEDYMFQFYVVLSLYKLAIRSYALSKKIRALRREDSSLRKLKKDIVNINVESVLLISKLVREEDYFFSVKKEYSQYTYTKYVESMLRKILGEYSYGREEHFNDLMKYFKSGCGDYEYFDKQIVVISAIKKSLVFYYHTEDETEQIFSEIVNKLKNINNNDI